MAGRAPPVVLLLAVSLLAGCAADAPTGGSGAAETDGLVATAETGLLRGVVVDEAIRPMPGVAIEVTRPGADALAATTTDAGTFGFDGLAAGSYVVAASKPGYLPATALAAVRAAEADPPVVQLQLARDNETVPYVTAIVFDGFIECAVRGGTGGVAACQVVEGRTNLTAERSLLKTGVDPGPAWVQAEMVWEATQPLADTMGFYLTQWRDDGSDAYMGIYPLNLGPSPLLLQVDGSGLGACATCVEDPLNMTGWEELWLTAMAGDLSSTRPPETCSPTGSPCLAGLGVVVEQRFQFFLHLFYRGDPPAGWRFTADGPPPL